MSILHRSLRPIPRRASLSLLALFTALFVAPLAPSFAAGDEAAVQPAYSGEGALLLPEGYREWVLLGSSLGLTYSQAEPGHQMFHNTLMEPSAYRHYVETGEFREGTMLVLLLFGQADAVTPGRHGTYAAEIHGVEMAVKDHARFDEGWAYYNFGGMGGGLRDEASAFGRDSCYACHLEHAKQDNVFLQFYPMLEEAAAGLVSTRAATDPAASPRQEPTTDGRAGDEGESEGSPADSARLALGGLDPVHLVDGREEMGKPEIVMVHEGYRYQFVSEPSRAQFEAEPEAYSIRNDTCLVVPGAGVDPALFAVHDRAIYAFASQNCVNDFLADPEFYLEPEG